MNSVNGALQSLPQPYFGKHIRERDIFLEILKKFEFSDLHQYCSVSKRWNETLNNPQVQRALCIPKSLRIPNNLVLEIVKILNKSDIANLNLVSKPWRKFIKNNKKNILNPSIPTRRFILGKTALLKTPQICSDEEIKAKFRKLVATSLMNDRARKRDFKVFKFLLSSNFTPPRQFHANTHFVSVYCDNCNYTLDLLRIKNKNIEIQTEPVNNQTIKKNISLLKSNTTFEKKGFKLDIKRKYFELHYGDMTPKTSETDYAATFFYLPGDKHPLFQINGKLYGKPKIQEKKLIVLWETFFYPGLMLTILDFDPEKKPSKVKAIFNFFKKQIKSKR